VLRACHWLLCDRCFAILAGHWVLAVQGYMIGQAAALSQHTNLLTSTPRQLAPSLGLRVHIPGHRRGPRDRAR
jgi:hypothetical protein